MLTSALVHINEPALVELTDDGRVRLRHSLVLSAQQDALDLFEDYIIILICQKQNQFEPHPQCHLCASRQGRCTCPEQ